MDAGQNRAAFIHATIHPVLILNIFGKGIIEIIKQIR
jgi:hypothetical protein